MSLKLSIITPCYNCEATLREAVDSCYTQGFSDDEFEIVMVDDGSQDNTWELMEKIAEEHNNIRIFQHQQNKGGGATRNTAVSHTKADIIFCLDSDDILFPNTLSNMYAYLLEKKADGIAFNYSTKFRGSNTEDIAYRLDLSPYLERPIALDSLLSRNNLHSPVVINFMYTKDAWQRAAGYPEYHGFDTQGFGWRFLTSGLTAYVCPNSDYLHRVDYHDSYYIREYNDGKININWRYILFENLPALSKEAAEVIKKFNYRNFTQDIFEELRKITKPFKEEYIITDRTLPELTQLKPIRPKSIHGLLLRLKNKILPYMYFAIKKIQSLIRHIKSFIITPFIIKDDSRKYKKLHIKLIERYQKKSNDYDYQDFLMPTWEKYRLHIEKRFLTEAGFPFLRDQIIKQSMFFAHTTKRRRDQLKLIKETFGERIKKLLKENSTASPILSNLTYKTSDNAIHQLHHLALFQKVSGLDLTQTTTVVEYGGGYGSLAKIFRRLNPSQTYCIIDIPIFSYIQALYLGTILGKDAIHIVEHKQDIEKGKINLIPLNKNTIENIAQALPKPDIFISTWALSESNKESHDLIRKLNYFNAKHLLLAHQDNNSQFPFASKITELNEIYKINYHKEIENLQGNKYLFAHKK